MGSRRASVPMSYVATIRRTEHKLPFDRDDVQRLLQADPSLSQLSNGVICWTPPETNRQLHINVDPGELWTDCFGTVDDEAFIEKLRSVANALDARLWDEEGTDITSPEAGKPPKFLGVLAPFVLLMLPFAFIVIVARLPWEILKLLVRRGRGQ